MNDNDKDAWIAESAREYKNYCAVLKQLHEVCARLVEIGIPKPTEYGEMPNANIADVAGLYTQQMNMGDFIGHAIVEHARRTLVLPGAWFRKVPIPFYTHYLFHQPSTFDPQEVWQELQQELGSPRKLSSAYGHEADTLRAHFPNAENSPTPKTEFSVAIKRGFWIPDDEPLSEGEKLLQAWRVFLVWAGFHDGLEEIVPEHFKYGARTAQVNAAFSYSVQERRIGFRLKAPLPEKLQDFLTEHPPGPPPHLGSK